MGVRNAPLSRKKGGREREEKAERSREERNSRKKIIHVFLPFANTDPRGSFYPVVWFARLAVFAVSPCPPKVESR